MITKYYYRIKDSRKANKLLSKICPSVNMVWNFCKQTEKKALKNKSVKLIDDKKLGKKNSIPYFFSSSEIYELVAGSSKELCLHSQTVRAISQDYITRKIQFKILLRWRGKRSLGWIEKFKSMLKYKAFRAASTYKEISERNQKYIDTFIFGYLPSKFEGIEVSVLKENLNNLTSTVLERLLPDKPVKRKMVQDNINNKEECIIKLAKEIENNIKGIGHMFN